jgi:hypothetical protein
MRPCSTAMLTVLAASLSLALPAAAAAAPDGTAYHIYRPNYHPAPAASPDVTTELYYAGPVIAKMRVVVVLWGKGVPTTTSSHLSSYFKALVNSTYVDQLAQYDTNITGVNGMPGTNQMIVRGSFHGKFKIKPANTSKNLTDADIQTELLAQIASGVLPASNLNTLYMMYFPPGITITLDGLTSCSSFGAYHEAVSSTVTPNNVFYGVMPGCGYSFPTETSVSAHEYAEATTDAIPTPGSNPAYPQAWNTSNGEEIGDLCEGHNGTLTAAGQTYTVQQVFLNTTHACSTGGYTSP